MSIPTALALPRACSRVTCWSRWPPNPFTRLRDLFRVESGLTPGTVRGAGRDARARCAASPPHARARAQNPKGPLRRERHREGQSGISPGHLRDQLTPPVASTLGGLRGDSGVLVLALAGAGLAEQNALEPADVIHAVNGKPVDSVESLRGQSRSDSGRRAPRSPDRTRAACCPISFPAPCLATSSASRRPHPVCLPAASPRPRTFSY